MQERSYAVRVHTHPKSWELLDWAGLCASEARAFTRRCKVSLHKVCVLLHFNSHPVSNRFVTVKSTEQRHSAYSISPRIIQRVICNPICQCVVNNATCEIV